MKSNDIQEIRQLDGMHYILPRRTLGKGRAVGWAILAFGILITVFMLFWMAGPIRAGLEDESSGKWFMIGFGLMGLPGLVSGLGIVLLGLAIALNMSHSEIIISEDMLIYIERAGAFKWRRKRVLNDIRRFVVSAPLSLKDDSGKKVDIYKKDLVALRAEGEGIKPLIIAPAYPGGLIKTLAEKLVASIASEHTELVCDMHDIEIVEESDEEARLAERVIEKPAETDIEYREIEQGFSLVVPPAGLWKGSKGLFFFSLLWNGFMVVFTMAWFASDEKVPLPLYLFLGLFWSIGIWMLIAAIAAGKRRVFLAVVGDVLAYRRIGIHGVKEQKFNISELSAIRMGPSGTKINDVPVMELQIILQDGKKIGLLSQRNNEELAWIASVLRNGTGKAAA